MRQIIAAVDDLFFAAKIRTTAKNLNLRISFARDAETIFVAAEQSLRESKPTLIVLDLEMQRGGRVRHHRPTEIRRANFPNSNRRLLLARQYGLDAPRARVGS